MAKNKLIALGMFAVIILTVFQWGFITFTVESQLGQALSMLLVVLGSVVAIMLFNKGESAH